MKYRNILVFGEPLLKEKSNPVEKVDSGIVRILKEMQKIMVNANGVGISAPQVGIPLRLVVIDVGEGPIYMVNPEIVWFSEEKTEFEEGCLSFPGVTVNIVRPERVRTAYLDEKGRKNLIEADGLLARAIQHEIDHLDGILIIDRATPEQRIQALQKLQENLKIIEEKGVLVNEGE